MVPLLALTIMMAGCAVKLQSSESGSKLTKDEVVKIAESKAQKEEVDLGKYDMTGCHYEYTEKGRTWTVFFNGKPPRLPGDYFLVWVDDQTRKATLMWGE